MAEEWAEQIKQRLLEYEQRREDIRVAADEVIRELCEVIPSLKHSDWELSKGKDISLSITIGHRQECFTEEEIWEAQIIYEFDECGSQVESGETTIKEALIKLILYKFKWISGR